MLPIMASSVSSERAFSSAGITISKRRNRLKPDVVEALQFLKCSYHHNLLFREEVSTQQEVVSRAPFLHNEGARHLRQRRTPQMDAWYALTRYSRFVPV